MNPSQHVEAPFALWSRIPEAGLSVLGDGASRTLRRRSRRLIAIAGSLTLPVAPASAQTVQDLQRQIDELKATIAELKAAQAIPTERASRQAAPAIPATAPPTEMARRVEPSTTAPPAQPAPAPQKQVQYAQPIVTYAQPIVQALDTTAPQMPDESYTAQPIVQPTYQTAPVQRVQAISATAPTINKGYGANMNLGAMGGL